MPLYDILCLACRKKGESLSTKSHRLQCPHCGSIEVKKLLSPVAKKSDMGDNSYPYIEHNLGDSPVEISDPSHRKRLMKEAGCIDAGNKRSTDKGKWV